MTHMMIYDWRKHAGKYNPTLPYERFIEAQREVVNQRLAQQLTHDVLILTTHPPTITLGARPLKEQLSHIKILRDVIEMDEIPDEELLQRARSHLREAYAIDLIKTNRGGSVWYHDYGVLQMYLIAEVPLYGISDIVYPLEEALLRILTDIGIDATRMDASLRREDKSFIGIWVREKKIAAIGIRIEQKNNRHVSMFGASLNINPNMSGCGLIDPCGIPHRQMTSIAQELNTRHGIPDIVLMPIIRQHMSNIFGTVVTIPCETI